MKTSTRDLYVDHHKTKRGSGFTLLENERGAFFSKNVGIGKSVLDLGCRDGGLTKWFSEKNEVTGVDIDPVSLERAQKSLGIRTIEMDLHGSWNEVDGLSFERVVAGEVLEHLFHPGNVVQKVSEKLKPGGVFIGSVPNAFSLKNKIRFFFGRKSGTTLEDPTHINHFSVHDVKVMLGRHFTNVQIFGMGRWGILAKTWPSMFCFDIGFVASNGSNPIQ